MNATDGFLKRSSDLVIRERGLLFPAEIAKLTDAEILRCRGVGRKALNALRGIYPFNNETAQRELARDLEKRKLSAVRSRPYVELGDIHEVTAARIVNGNLLIKVKGHKELLPVWLLPSLNLEGEGLQDGDGFGSIPEDGLIRMGISFPKLLGVHRVSFMEFQNYDDFWSAEIQITTDQATFQITVYGEEEAPDGRAEEGSYDAISFAEEIKQDPDMAELHGKLERAWALFEEELKVGAAIEALRALSSVSTDIEGLMQAAMKRAASRGVKIICRVRKSCWG